MSFKINHKAIENYTQRITEQTLNRAFYTKSSLCGNDIINLTPAPQINVLILKILFEKWNEEAQKLRSKYFDFTHPEVELALQTFKNKLSHHIKVDKSTFESLLSQAVRDTLLLAFQPREAVKRIFLTDITQYKEQLKFLKLHPHLVKTLIEINDATLVELHAVVDTWENYSQPNLLLEQTASIQPAIIEDFMINEVDPVSPKVSVTDQPKVVSSDQMTLNDLFSKKDEPTTLASKFQEKSKMGSLQSGINLNQRFTFVKELFDGNMEEYQQVITGLDASENYENAIELLAPVQESHAWGEKEDVAHNFIELLKKRFN